jgi:hypothetical protein
VAPDEIIVAHRDYYGSYHHHKETMAHGAATVYIGAATAVILKARDVLGGGDHRCVVSTLLVLGFIVGHAFVIWQLTNREFAADIVRAATTVLSRLARPNSPPPDMTPTPWRGLELPQVLVNELTSPTRPACFLGRARTASVLTVAAMLGWSGLAVWALVS